MNRRLFIPLALGAFALAGTLNARTARADLFALAPSVGQILRIDSTTLEVTRTYDSPFGPFGPSAFAGLAFDGQILSWTQGFAGIHELHQLDVVNEAWLPPTPLFEIIPPNQLTGLAALGAGFGSQLLGVASTTQPALGVPAMLYRIEPFGFATPIGELPPQYLAFGLDVDAATGEIWVAARNLEPVTPPHFELLQISVPELLPEAADASAAYFEEQPQQVNIGVVIQRTLAPAFAPAFALRGIGFDDGRMFASTGNRILYEIDRANGEILRSVQLPGSFIIGGLAGGTVVPEPSGAIVAAISTMVLAGVRPPRYSLTTE